MTAIYFDLDGTLTDPKPGITRSIQYALKKLDREVPTEDELTWCIGPPLRASFVTLLGSDSLADRGLALYRERFADVGLFENAVDYRIGSFTAFPDAIAADRARFENKTVVSYCTGGIRCEKAVLHMQDIGMDNVFQLEGGILKYFEETDGTHWRGECFVFDERGAVDKSLAPAPLPANNEGLG